MTSMYVLVSGDGYLRMKDGLEFLKNHEEEEFFVLFLGYVVLLELV